MKRYLSALALSYTMLVAVSAGAQPGPLKPLQFGIAAGIPIPTGELAEIARPAFSALATLAFNPAALPVGFRVDLGYSGFEPKGGGKNINFTSVSGNVVYGLPAPGVWPYLIGGAGFYASDVDVTGGAGADTNFGLNIGGGLNIPLSGFQTFLEVRYNRVASSISSVSFIPITFGIVF